MVVKWDLRNPENGQLVAKVPHSVYALHYDAANNTLVVGHNHEGLHFIDLSSGKEAGSINLTDAAIFDIQSFGNLIFAATGDGKVTVFDKEKGVVVKVLKLSQKSARALAINPRREEMAIGFSDHTIRVINLSDYTVKHVLNGHSNSVFTVRYDPDFQHLITGGRDAHLKIWSVDKNYDLRESIAAHMYAINHVDFSPDGKHFVTCSMDKSIKVWDAQYFKLLKVIDKARHAGHGTSVNRLLWSHYRNQLISCSDDRTISIWDLKFDNNQ